jgi:hypothetical protein
MANEFKHLAVGTELTQSEYESVGGHVLDSQAVGDIIYASSTSQLSRLGIGSTGAILTVTGGIPAWDTTWSPTGHLIPASDDTYDLGSPTDAWQDLFLEGDITLTDAGTISTTAGSLSLTPASGSAIVLDGTISIDAGVVTGATSITSTAFVGDITGDVTGNADTATLATTVTATANNSTDETVYLTFVDGATSAQGIETDTGLTYNPSSGVLTSTSFTGALTGNVTGNVSGTAATVTSGTQASITTLANVTTVGALNAGSISTNFGAINNGSSAITTTGLVSAGSLTVTGTTTLNGNLILGDAAADTLALNATITGATPLSFEGATANGFETSFTFVDPTADRTITFADSSLTVNAAADISGTTLASNVVTSSLTAVGTIATGVWQGTAIASGYIAADAITGAKIADDAIDSEHYTDGSIDNDHIANGTIALAKTALVAGTNITLATNTLNVDDAFLINSGDDTTSGTITAAGFTAGDAGQVYFSDTAPASDHTATGVVISIASGESVAAFNSVYIRSDGEVGPADADAASTMPAIGVALEAKGDGEATKILIAGVLRDDTYNFTPGADLFIGTTAGQITATAPSGSGDTVQKIGVALTADSIYVNFNTTEVLLA